MRSSKLIDPVRDFGPVLLSVEKPARYVGGEYGAVRKDDADFTVAIAFPDLYEIGMSNQALRILYNSLNRLDGVSCERVFAPAPDFEEVLTKTAIPLYTLERGAPLCDLDLIGITMGYELGITGVLSILKSGGVPLLSEERGEGHPIVLMGGPAASNPAPFRRFIDGVWIGEAEAGFFGLVADLRDLKRRGARRGDLMERASRESAMWTPGKKAKRAVFSRFPSASDANVLPVPSMRIVQDHGSVEIMRGCPNGCRFCHAGFWYRPMRQKDEGRVRSEVDACVAIGGYREITLASLSSGDYSGIGPLIRHLNRQYSSRHVSFQLPSLKVSSFSLPLLEQLSEVRKSGLTFAVETPVDAWQFAINKDVVRDNVLSILREAKGKGWRSAKFYFMIGLPVEDSEHRREEEEIVEFLTDISQKINIQINVNIGTFVPKPHTPYQWVRQLPEEEAGRKLGYIRNELKRRNIKLSTHDPFTSTLEGVFSRGDERVGELVHAAFDAGCRLDAWDDFIRRDTWRTLIAQRKEIASTALSERALDDHLPWDDIESGVGKGALKREFQRSTARTVTSACEENCTCNCGVCRDDSEIVHNTIQSDLEAGISESASTPAVVLDPHAPSRLVVFSFTKAGSAAFIPHLSVIEVFSKAFVRADLPVRYTEGFNPLPKLNFAAPLSIGITADAEIAIVEMSSPVIAGDFLAAMNARLPAGFVVTDAECHTVPEGVKKCSAASMLWGFTYSDPGGNLDYVPAGEEKEYRSGVLAQTQGTGGELLHRVGVLAKSAEPESPYVPYFEAYRRLYGQYRN